MQRGYCRRHLPGSILPRAAQCDSKPNPRGHVAAGTIFSLAWARGHSLVLSASPQAASVGHTCPSRSLPVSGAAHRSPGGHALQWLQQRVLWAHQAAHWGTSLLESRWAPAPGSGLCWLGPCSAPWTVGPGPGTEVDPPPPHLHHHHFPWLAKQKAGPRAETLRGEAKPPRNPFHTPRILRPAGSRTRPLHPPRGGTKPFVEDGAGAFPPAFFPEQPRRPMGTCFPSLPSWGWTEATQDGPLWAAATGRGSSRCLLAHGAVPKGGAIPSWLQWDRGFGRQLQPGGAGRHVGWPGSGDSGAVLGFGL